MLSSPPEPLKTEKSLIFLPGMGIFFKKKSKSLKKGVQIHLKCGTMPLYKRIKKKRKREFGHAGFCARTSDIRFSFLFLIIISQNTFGVFRLDIRNRIRIPALPLCRPGAFLSPQAEWRLLCGLADSEQGSFRSAGRLTRNPVFCLFPTSVHVEQNI